MPIGKTVGTFCVLYVPAKCFLGWLGTNRCHFVPAILLVGTNRCLFVPVVPLVLVGPWCLWCPSARTARGVSGARRPVLPVVSLVPVGPYCPWCPWVPTTRKEPSPGRLITRKPEWNLLRGGGKDYFVFVSFANVHHVHYLLNWNGFVCVD